MILFIVLCSQPFVMHSSDTRKPLLSCGIASWTNKSEHCSGQVVEHRALKCTQTIWSLVQEGTPGSHILERGDQKIKIIVTYDKKKTKQLVICWCISVPKARIKFLPPFVSLLHHKQAIFVVTRYMSCQCWSMWHLEVIWKVTGKFTAGRQEKKRAELIASVLNCVWPCPSVPNTDDNTHRTLGGSRMWWGRY